MPKPKVKDTPGWEDSSMLRKAILMAQTLKSEMTPKARPYDPLMEDRRAAGKNKVVDAMYKHRMDTEDELERILK